MPVFHYTVDGEPQETTAHELTPTQILTQADIDAATHYLVEIDGNNRVSFQGKANEEIHMHDHQKFISVSIGPTPVSRV